MKSKIVLFAIAGLLFAGLAGAQEQPEKKETDPKETGQSGWTKKNRLEFQTADGQFSLRLGILGQFLYTAIDPDVGDSESSFRTRRVRPDLRGKLFGSVGYRLQYELAGSPSLLDFYLNWGPGSAKLQAGQFKAPFGRQELTSIAKQHFVDRSIASARFAPSRQQGLALLGKNAGSTFEYGIRVFNGNGRNRSSDDNSEKMIAGRAVFNLLGSYDLDESALDYPDSPRLSFGFAGLSNTDGEGVDAVDITRFGVELAFKVQGLSFISEFYQEQASPDVGDDLDTDGLYAQLGYLFPGKRLELALRHAFISPDVAGGSADQTETGVALNFYINKHGQKVQMDYRQLEFDADPSRDRAELRVQAQITF